MSKSLVARSKGTSEVIVIIYRDLNKKLDMSMAISISFSHRILPLVEKEIEIIPARIKSSESSHYLDLYLHGSDISRLSGIISSFDFVRKGEWLVVRLTGEELAELADIEKEVLTIPTSLLSASYVRGGRLFIQIRFHHSDLERASSIIGRAAQSNGNIHIEDFGPSPGEISFLDQIDSRIKLELVSFTYDRPEGRADDTFPPHYAETGAEGTGDGEYRVIAYSEPDLPVRDEVEKIPGSDGLYSYSVYSPFMVETFSAFERARIPIASTIVRIDAQHLHVYQFIPETALQEFLEILFDLGLKHTEAGLLLTSVEPYNKEVWDSL